MKNYLKLQNIIIIPKDLCIVKTEAKNDNKGVRLIKEFLLTMYKKFDTVNNKRDNE